jgi:hypothetical protein
MKENIAEMTWKLHRTMAGAWVVLSSVPTFRAMNRRLVENWLIVHGCARREELDRLFHDAEEKGEGIATGSGGSERPR